VLGGLPVKGSKASLIETLLVKNLVACAAFGDFGIQKEHGFGKFRAHSNF